MQEQKIKLLLQQAGTSASFAIGAACVSLAVLGWYHPTPWLLAWALGVILVSLARRGFHRRFSARPGTPADQARWLERHKWSGILSGILWGLLAAFPTGHLPQALQIYPLLAPALVATAAISSYGLRPDHYRAFLLGLIGALLAAHGWRHGADGVAIDFVMFAILGLMLDIMAHRHARALHQAMDAQQALEAANRRLTEQHKTIQQEEHIARHVFHQLTLSSDQDIPGVHTWNQAMGSLSGDLIQAALAPQGDVFLFLGDFTGHGLPAALGALPASSVFRTMVHKGLDVPVIARELNSKLYTLLPTGYFCCAVLMRLSADRRCLTLWNGGLPPVLIQCPDGTGLKQVAADNLPLGVVADADFSARCSQWSLGPGDRVLAYSDGLTEAENVDGEMWGRERLTELLQAARPGEAVLDRLKEELLEFTNLAPASDDISVIEVLAAETAARQAVA